MGATAPWSASKFRSGGAAHARFFYFIDEGVGTFLVEARWMAVIGRPKTSPPGARPPNQGQACRARITNH